MEHKPYNGWYNYETWNFFLHYGDMMQNMEIGDDHHELREYMTDYIDEAFSIKYDGSWLADTVTTTLGEVNWQEIWEHLRED